MCPHRHSRRQNLWTNDLSPEVSGAVTGNYMQIHASFSTTSLCFDTVRSRLFFHEDLSHRTLGSVELLPQTFWCLC